MKIVLLIPKVVDRFKAQFPETTNNAYPYFNYDHRVVNERVDRGDKPSTYKGPDEFKDSDYQSLLNYARTMIDPNLKKYSKEVACEEALNLAVRSYGNGAFDGKVNANKFQVLLSSLCSDLDTSGNVGINLGTPNTHADVTAKKKKAPAQTVVPHRVLKQLGIKVREVGSRPGQSKNPQFVKTQDGIVVHKKAENENPLKEERMAIKNAQQYTERLDKVATEIQAVNPDFALAIDMVSDVIEGRRSASTLKFDADEARYMAGRFNFSVRKRDADEGFMDHFNANTMDQVITVRKNPVPIKVAYQKVK